MTLWLADRALETMESETGLFLNKDFIVILAKFNYAHLKSCYEVPFL